MKIRSDKGLTGIDAYNFQKNVTKKDESQKVEISGKKDNVELSKEIDDIKKVREVIDNTPDIREDKIEGIKESIDKGTYNVNGKKIAEKMIKQVVIDELL